MEIWRIPIVWDGKLVKPKFGNGKNQLELCAFSCNFFFVNSVVQEMHICALANDHVKCNELEQCNKSIL